MIPLRSSERTYSTPVVTLVLIALNVLVFLHEITLEPFQLNRFILHYGLVPDRLHSLNIFEGSEQEQSRARLVTAMDAINNKYGLSTLAPATMLTAFKAAPTRIAFHTIPEMF